jgi:hypothetical protein
MSKYQPASALNKALKERNEANEARTQAAEIVAELNRDALALEARVEVLEAALRGLIAWTESPAVKHIEAMAYAHGAKYRSEDVAAWDVARAALDPSAGDAK